eukprot:128955-Prorocentrum_lima.AAC.1
MLDGGCRSQHLPRRVPGSERGVQTLGIRVYVLDNCFDPPDTTPRVQSLGRFLDAQPKRSVG